MLWEDSRELLLQQRNSNSVRDKLSVHQMYQRVQRRPVREEPVLRQNEGELVLQS